MYMKLIILVSLFVVPILSLDYKIRLNEDGIFVDNHGRELFFHGINMVQKFYPWYNESFTNTSRLQYYKEWGFNFVRLGTMWAGAVPEQAGVYNETYLDILQNIVKQLDKYGMVSLLDMHQDVISSLYENYDGAPLWLLKSLIKPSWFFKYPFPISHGAIENLWTNGYLTYEVSDAFQRLYDNEGNSMVHWGDFWKKVAQTVKEMNSVIGYELINEPWAGNFYKNPLRLLPGYAGRHNLMPAYEYLVDEIRKIDNDTLIFVEPLTYGVFFKSGSSVLGDGLDRMPKNDRKRSVLSYHYYCWILQTVNASKVYPFWKQVLCDHILLNNVFKVVKETQAITGGGTFLTEFGLCAPDESTKSINTIECKAVMDLADRHLQSWAYWDSVFFKNDTNEPIWSTVRLFARPYARAVSGKSLSMSFEAKTAVFNFTYKPDSKIWQPTEFFIPSSVHYPRGYKVITEPEARIVKGNNILLIYPKHKPLQQSVAVLPLQ